MAAGIQLKKQLGIQNYVIFDENNDVGGTWLVNKYPGCACDVASHLYSYSFEPNPSKIFNAINRKLIIIIMYALMHK